MRKLATAAAVSMALASGHAFGLALGEIEMQSALNQRLDAEIPLTAVEPGELDGVIVQLASAEAFSRAGIDRSSVLTDLQFSVDQSSGVPVIKIESSEPVVEPFLNFLVEVDWPQGRMVREYTVLLDPPVFVSPNASTQSPTAEEPSLVQSGDSSLAVPAPIERDNGIEDNGIEVELTDLEDAAIEPVLSLDEATSDVPLADDGELVTLDTLTDSEGSEVLLSDLDNESSIVSLSDLDNEGSDVPLSDLDTEGSIVSLSDLNAPNTDAIEQREADALDALTLDDIEVETPNAVVEVEDTFVIGQDSAPVASELTDDDGSTIVSLDDLEEPSQLVADGGVENTVTVGQGDTLFEIARDNAPSGTSVQQMMMAMLAANESGFINNNINLVRAGAILRVPDADEANTLTQAQAVAAISEQQRLWQDYRDSLRSTAATQVAQNIVPEDAPVQQEADAAAAPDPDETLASLSDEAREILESARQEVLNRDELNIVADNSVTSATASATADETTDTDAEARVGEVNRRLQLAREELLSTQFGSDDLNEQAVELTDQTEKLDAMVSLRQNEVARLEAQLEQARIAAEQAAEAENLASAADSAIDSATDSDVVAAADAAADAAGNAVSEGQAAVSDVASDVVAASDTAADAAADAVSGAQDAATDVASGVIAGAADAVSEGQAAADGVVNEAGDAVEQVADAGTNALTEAGETLEQVELFSSEDDSAAAEVTEPVATAETAQSWYQQFLQDPKRLAIAGVGALGLLGVLGTLLFRRKRPESEEWSLDNIDEAEFNSVDAEAPDLTTGVSAGTSRLDDASGAIAAAGAAGVAGAAVAGNSLLDRSQDGVDDFDQKFEDTVDDVNDSTLAFSADDESGMLYDDDLLNDEEALDKDDTISEVDVYLAYGLHGQAEDLLTKAIERNPDNPQYALKLLQTYHGQGNTVAFHEKAKNFHASIGGNHTAEWKEVSLMGAELLPNDPLYASAQDAVSRVGNRDADSTFGDSDFLPPSADGNDALGSFSRDFSAGDDESALMNESIDPAFAFDESDLEATGDFSSITDELAAEADSAGISMPEIDVPSVDVPGYEEPVAAAGIEDSLSLEEIGELSESVDDLTLDLDQLSGDLELDSTELINSADLLNSDLSDLEIPDLTTDNDLLLDSTSLGDGADEMDTMMDLAKAYIDMGDKDSASNTLDEIVKGGNPEQVSEAENLLRNIS